MSNFAVRSEMMKANLKLWEVADAMGIADYTLSRKLRYELPEEEQEKIIRIIHTIKENRHESAASL